MLIKKIPIGNTDCKQFQIEWAFSDQKQKSRIKLAKCLIYLSEKKMLAVFFYILNDLRDIEIVDEKKIDIDTYTEMLFFLLLLWKFIEKWSNNHLWAISNDKKKKK